MTGACALIGHIGVVSIHTPTKGVTHQSYQNLRQFCVSIHTPTKGVTEELIKTGYRYRVSIHTPTKGVTSHRPAIMRTVSFNPHTHEGCDQVSVFHQALRWCFNPHTHEGCDFGWFVQLLEDEVSIHTPTKGVTAYSANG